MRRQGPENGKIAGTALVFSFQSFNNFTNFTSVNPGLPVICSFFAYAGAGCHTVKTKIIFR